jgi:hypothetical protein
VPLALLAVTPATADRAAEISVRDVLTDVDPCTGNAMEVTLDVTLLVHEHDGRAVARGERTVTTSSGYSGSGSSLFVMNGNVERFRVNDMATDEAGHRIRASSVFVLDVRRETIRVDRFELICVGS